MLSAAVISWAGCSPVTGGLAEPFGGGAAATSTYDAGADAGAADSAVPTKDSAAPTNDQCPDDDTKEVPGACGCGVPDADDDGDGAVNCMDGCPGDDHKTVPGVCGCGVADDDWDQDGIPDCADVCPGDAMTSTGDPERCDDDGDGAFNVDDVCPNDSAKVEPLLCGCGNPETCPEADECPDDPDKLLPGACGCGLPDTDTDADGEPDCIDVCGGAPPGPYSVVVVGSNAKRIYPNGDFWVRDRLYGRGGKWITETRFAVFTDTWGWWVGELTADGGMMTGITGDEEEVLFLLLRHYEVPGCP